MKYSRELTVGLVIVLAMVIFGLGIRYFEDLPLMGGSYTLRTAFDDARGLVVGSPVRINGVSAGTVRRVDLRPLQDDVAVEFQLRRGVEIPEGSYARVSGIELMGNVQLEIVLARGATTAVEPGGFIPGRNDDLVGSIMNQAPLLTARTDTVLAATQEAIADVRRLIAVQGELLGETLVTVNTATTGFNRFMTTYERDIGEMVRQTSLLAGDLQRIAASNSDSLTVALQQFNRVMRQLETGLGDLQQTGAGIDSLIVGVQRGDGTLGRLANDALLYQRLDSMLLNVNSLLTSFEDDPGRFLREFRLIGIF